MILPAIVRLKENGRYEMVLGHRRKRESGIAELKTILCVVKDLTDDGVIINDVVRNINNEFSIKILNIQQFAKYDECIINSNQADWKNVLAIYVVKTSNGENKKEFLTFDNKKSQVLKTVFWDMNQITHSLK